MPEDSTPITFGLFAIAAFGFTASTGFLLWLWRQLRSLKDEILNLVKADTERTTGAIRELAVQIAGVDGKTSILRDRLHALELDLAEDGTRFSSMFACSSVRRRVLNDLLRMIVPMAAPLAGGNAGLFDPLIEALQTRAQPAAAKCLGFGRLADKNDPSGFSPAPASGAGVRRCERNAGPDRVRKKEARLRRGGLRKNAGACAPARQ